MKDILTDIVEHKLQEIAHKQANVSLASVREFAETSHDRPRGFANALISVSKQNKPALIAEVKMMSPSKGLIRADFKPVEVATAYQNGGATCLSVLTDEKFFGGSNSYFADIRKKTTLPMIRKDFMLLPYQIYESRALGADCILLIMACLDIEKAAALEDIALTLGMDVLIEVHNEDELAMALQLKSKLIGVNNRDLKTFNTSLETGKRLSKLIPDHYIKVCESGIYTNSEVRDMMASGFSSFLVGESLMRENDIEKATKQLIGN